MIVQELLKNKGGQSALIFLRDATSKAAATGLTLADIAVSYSGDGGAFTALTAPNPTAELTASTPTRGFYRVALTQAETNFNEIILKVTGSGTASNAETFPKEGYRIKTVPDIRTDVVGTSGVSTADTLDDIREYFDTYILPVMQTGNVVTEFSGSGWIYRIAEKVRRWVDEPSTNAKFNSTQMLDMIKESVREMFTDVMLCDDRQMVVRYDLTTVADQLDYVLPPTVGQVLRIASMDTDYDTPEYEIWPTSLISPSTYGWRQEGNMLRLHTKNSLEAGEVLTVFYIPNGEFRPHVGTTADVSTDGLTITLDATPTDGSLDTRPNAYGGYVFRVLPNSDATAPYEQERLIASSSHTTNTVTLRRPLDPIPTSHDAIPYEIVPVFPSIAEDVLAVHIARRIAVAGGNYKKEAGLRQVYAEKARSFRIQMSKAQTRLASRFDNQTPENEAFSAYWTVL